MPRLCLGRSRLRAESAWNPNVERVIHELVFEDIGSGAHIWALIVITVLEVVVAYPIVCLSRLTKPCFVKEESHEAQFDAV